MRIGRAPKDESEDYFFDSNTMFDANENDFFGSNSMPQSVPPIGPTPPVGASPPMSASPPIGPTPPVGASPPMSASPPIGPTPPVGVSPPNSPPSWEEDGFTWRMWEDGTLEYFDETTGNWLVFKLG